MSPGVCGWGAFGWGECPLKLDMGGSPGGAAGEGTMEDEPPKTGVELSPEWWFGEMALYPY